METSIAIKDIVSDDYGIIANYISDEYGEVFRDGERVTRNIVRNIGTDHVAKKIEVDGLLVGFYSFKEVNDKTVFINTYYMAPKYRKYPRVNLRLAQELVADTMKYDKAVYVSITKNMARDKKLMGSDSVDLAQLRNRILGL